MSQHVGVWAVGEEIKGLLYTVLNPDRTPKDLTGYTAAKIIARRRGETAAAEIAGTIAANQTTNRGEITFPSLAQPITPKRKVGFEGRVQIMNGSDLGWLEPFEWTVEVWP